MPQFGPVIKQETGFGEVRRHVGREAGDKALRLEHFHRMAPDRRVSAQREIDHVIRGNTHHLQGAG